MSLRITPGDPPELDDFALADLETRSIAVAELLVREGYAVPWDTVGLQHVPARRRLLGAAAGMLVAVGAFTAVYGLIDAARPDTIAGAARSVPVPEADRIKQAPTPAGQPPSVPKQPGQPPHQQSSGLSERTASASKTMTRHRANHGHHGNSRRFGEQSQDELRADLCSAQQPALTMIPGCDGLPHR